MTHVSYPSYVLARLVACSNRLKSDAMCGLAGAAHSRFAISRLSACGRSTRGIYFESRCLRVVRMRGDTFPNMALNPDSVHKADKMKKNICSDCNFSAPRTATLSGEHCSDRVAPPGPPECFCLREFRKQGRVDRGRVLRNLSSRSDRRICRPYERSRTRNRQSKLART